MMVTSVYCWDSKKHDAANKNAERHKVLSQRAREYGRVPWIIGGDWNQPTEVPRFTGLSPTIVSTGEPTFENKTCIDWYAVSNGLGRMVGTKVYHDSTLHGHKPVEMIIMRTPDDMLGKKLFTPHPFDGILKKQAKQNPPEEGTYYELNGTLEDQWEVWNRTSEVTLANKEGKHEQKYFGRGMEPRMVPNTVSAPRDSKGFAVTADIDKLQVFVNRTARLNWLKDKELTDTHEYRTLSGKIIRAKTDDPLLEAPLLSIKERMAELKNSSDKKERRDGKSG